MLTSNNNSNKWYQYKNL